MKIEIQLGDLKLPATLLDNETGRAIYRALPFTLPYDTWGDEIYFSIPVDINPKDGREVVDVGDLAYWPPGNAFCIFYGRTPMSTDDRPRAASEVSVFGQIERDATLLRKAKGKTITITAAREGFHPPFPIPKVKGY